MPTDIKVIPIQTKPIEDFSAFIAGVEEGLDVVAEQIKFTFENPTKNWSQPVVFEVKKTFLGREISTENERYVLINYGTNRSGRVYPVHGKALHLPSRQFPKTRPGDIFGYTGVREYERGQNLFSSVKKSSIRPRKWDEVVERTYTEYVNIADFIQRKINEHLGKK